MRGGRKMIRSIRRNPSCSTLTLILVPLALYVLFTVFYLNHDKQKINELNVKDAEPYYDSFVAHKIRQEFAKPTEQKIRHGYAKPTEEHELRQGYAKPTEEHKLKQEYTKPVDEHTGVVVDSHRDDGAPGIGEEETFVNVPPPNALKLVGKMNKPPLEINVIEEHHEALPYWFDAGDRRIIPKTGNTLIHIDGHADFMPPYYFEGYPFFKWPTKDEVRFLMQRNDAFIQAAAMTGMISRVIWVWPEWDRVNHDMNYVSAWFKLGWTAVAPEFSSRTNTYFCSCMVDNDNVTFECAYYNEDMERVVIKSEQCVIKHTVFYEEVHELTAVSLLSQKQWIKKSESIFLDIDEDFFGCSYVIQPLLDSNITMEWLEDIDDRLRLILCPETTDQEAETNQILLQTVSLLLLQKTCRQDKKSKCPDSGLRLQVEDVLNDLLSNAHKENKTQLCVRGGKMVKYEFFTKRFVRELSSLTPEQLRILQGVGFCLVTTPKDMQMYRPQGFGLCYGANTPTNSAVTVFNPTAKDIKKRSLIMKLMTEAMKYNPPKFVTLCRSGRDGFTPVKYFSTIENAILSHLNDTFKKTYVKYDTDLMGGEKGRTQTLRKHRV